MEIEAISPVPVVAKKLWSMVRVLFFMMKKGIAKSKIMVELQLMLERGKLAGKSLLNNTLMFHHQYSSSFTTCRSHNSSFISPHSHEYEFSCNNTPANPLHVIIKRKNRNNRFSKSSYKYDDVSTLNAVQKVLEMLNNTNNNNNEKVEVAANSPLVTLPGFGKSPIGRQLRVTDSPFPLKDEGDSHQVDMAAEEFINKFYKDLKLQKRSVAAAFQSPYHNYLWDR